MTDPEAPISPDPTPERGLSGPSSYLVGINLVVALLGFLQGIFVARALGADGLGAVGVILAMSAVAANLIDVRLPDLAFNLYYADDSNPSRGTLIQMCLLLSAGVALVIVLLVASLGSTSLHLFVDAEVPILAVLLAAYSAGAGFAGNAFFYMQRLTGRFGTIGVARLVIQIVATTATILAVSIEPSVVAYFVGASVGSTVSVIANVSVTRALFEKHLGVRLFAGGWTEGWAAYRSNLRFLFSTNLLGYTKMFHRAGDVLLVGYFSSDAVTGVYRLARSLSDSLYVIFDAVNQVHFPVLLDDLHRGRIDHFSRRARLLMLGALLLCSVLLLGGAVLLPPLISVIFGPAFSDVTAPLLAFILPFGVVLGIHTWLWPVVVRFELVEKFVWFSLAAAGVHYAVAGLGFWRWESHLTAAAVGYGAYYLVLYVPSIGMAARKQPDLWRALRTT